MTEARRSRTSRRSSSRRDRGATMDSIPQLERRIVRNPYAPMKVVTDDQVEALHEASLRILEELGIELMSERARNLFEEAGATVDHSSGLVRVDRDLVMQTIKTAPPIFSLTPRNADNRMWFGENHVNFTLVAGPPNVHDCINGRRNGNYEDFVNFSKLAQHFNAIHMMGNQVCAPVEMPANSRHLDTYDASLTYTDKSFHCTAIGRGRAVDAIRMMAISRGISMDEIAEDPGVTTIISVNSPRRFDGEMAEGLMAMSEHGQSVAVTPFTLMGAMTPVTLPAALAQQNAEALFGIMLTQLTRPGAPVLYGSYTSNVDMRSGAPAFGTPENAKANIISGQLARRYNLPYRVSPTNASNAADAQSVYETQMALWGTILGGGNLIYHAAGWLEGGLTASYEKFILDVEMIQHMIEFLRPVEINDAELAFDAMRDVPTGGHFFGHQHTMERYETAFYQPLVSDWQNYENWELAGAKDATQRATDLWQRALKEYEQPAMDPAIREELDAYMAKRKEEIGTGEP